MSSTGFAQPAADERSLDAAAAPGDPSRRVSVSRLRGRAAGVSLAAASLAALGQAAGTVVVGRVAARPTEPLVALLGLCVVGGAVFDTAGRAVWAGVVDRAEGRLRADLLSAALHQPLDALSEQAVGEILDRVDDDTHELGTLLRRVAWDLVRMLLRLGPMWVVAGLTWWPSWIVFPIAGGATYFLARPLTAEVAERKFAEEVAWTDHAAVMEEGVAARDDLRSSLGQAYLVRRCAELSAAVHERVASTCRASSRLGRRLGLLLHGILAAIAVTGVALSAGGRLPIASLVTLFLVTSQFVGQIDQTARHLPDLQAGIGAVNRIRGLMATRAEPSGGLPPSPGALGISVRGLRFSYPHGNFCLRDVDLEVPAGTTVALVGRTGSGKSTLAALFSRAAEPPTGAVLVGGVDVTTLDLEHLRAAVGVVTQRTELVAGTVEENVSLFADVPRRVVAEALQQLGLSEWVRSLPDGLDTVIGPGGTTLSAGEEQLVAFARLLVRDVQVVVLDEATARMDPVTEARITRAADRLLAGRTGVVIAHRLSTTARAHQVAVLDGGRIVQVGPRDVLARVAGPFRDLLDASAWAPANAAEVVPGVQGVQGVQGVAASGATISPSAALDGSAGRPRWTGAAPTTDPVGTGPDLARSTWSALRIHPAWGIGGALLFQLGAMTGAFGTLTGFVWGHLVASLSTGHDPSGQAVLLVCSLLAAPLLLSLAFSVYPRWWVAVMLRVRLAVLRGQTMQHRLPRTPPGEVVARAMDSDRFARYADRWVDFVNGVVVAAVTAIAGGSALAGAVLLLVMALSAAASATGSPLAGRSAAASSQARARFGRSLASALDAARTVKLAGATPAVHRHLREIDRTRVGAAVREHRVQALLDGVPMVLVQCGVVGSWLIFLGGGWGLATALLVSTAVGGFEWFGRVAGSVITEAPGVRAWKDATARLAGGRDLMKVPSKVDLVAGTAPVPPIPPRTGLARLEVRELTARHPDGTIGVHNVSFSIDAGEMVVLLGAVGSGKSSLLAALAGLADHSGVVLWNGRAITDPQIFLRPGQVAYVAQIPLVLSGTFSDNITLDHQRHLGDAINDARLETDIDEAGGAHAVVGHRGVRLSGGQIQRLALARALAAQAELLLADDVSSALDARTEQELWQALRRRGTTVVASTSKRSALQQADRAIVLVAGEVADQGPWARLAPRWEHLAA